jgi:acylphosphatase
MLSRVHVIVSGRVQGVAFRYYARRWAISLSLTGWVRNLFDGRVETVAEGDRKHLEEFISLLGEGPGTAVVENVECRWEEPLGEFDGFRIEITSS